MITRSEYLEAKAIVDEYEQEEYADESLDEDEPFEEECENCGALIEECNCRDIEHCDCGAWAYSEKQKRTVRVSDCIC